MVHGWPGSFYEFSEVINPLTSGEGGQAFHAIVPSLPGFVWSQAPQRRGWTMKDTARIFDALMQRLGYHRYCVQAGDWGQFVARELGAQYSERCEVVHLNWCPGALPEDVNPTEREATCKAKGENWRTAHVGYAVLMRTRPQTLGWMLQDNPVGLLGFVGEKVSRSLSKSRSPHVDALHSTKRLPIRIYRAQQSGVITSLRQYAYTTSLAASRAQAWCTSRTRLTTSLRHIASRKRT